MSGILIILDVMHNLVVPRTSAFMSWSHNQTCSVHHIAFIINKVKQRNICSNMLNKIKV